MNLIYSGRKVIQSIVFILTLILFGCNSGTNDSDSRNVNSDSFSIYKDTLIYPTHWRRTVDCCDSMYETIDYRIKWTRYDSIIEYQVNNKGLKKFRPNFLYDMTISDRKILISILFKDSIYNVDLPKFGYDYKDINTKFIKSIKIEGWENGEFIMQYYYCIDNQRTLDSAIGMIFKR